MKRVESRIKEDADEDLIWNRDHHEELKNLSDALQVVSSFSYRPEHNSVPAKG